MSVWLSLLTILLTFSYMFWSPSFKHMTLGAVCEQPSTPCSMGGGRADLDRVLFCSNGFLVSHRCVPTDCHLFYPLDLHYILFCLNQLNSSPFPCFLHGEFLEEPERMGGVPESRSSLCSWTLSPACLSPTVLWKTHNQQGHGGQWGWQMKTHFFPILELTVLSFTLLLFVCLLAESGFDLGPRTRYSDAATGLHPRPTRSLSTDISRMGGGKKETMNYQFSFQDPTLRISSSTLISFFISESLGQSPLSFMPSF